MGVGVVTIEPQQTAAVPDDVPVDQLAAAGMNPRVG